ncbi:OmpA family protein [Apibacter sp. HY039]|uniref:OmpA family protein n=1 Tax=Apibacter sp. HY039 TaxID=2501476 RepID=UPI000FEBDF4B|nr:OmpA family protein [Apibacter sp. HY039]
MNKNCILFVLIALCSCFKTQAQTQTLDSSSFTEDYVKFTNDQKQFNDWSISIYGGVPWLQSSDFTSIQNGASGTWRVGYDVQASIDKQISHVFGISLVGQMGESKQGYNGGPEVDAKTKYHSISVIGDVKVSSLFRRIDNRSPYRWGIHAYAGVGFIGYKAYRKDLSRGETEYYLIDKADLDIDSFFGQFGMGIVYKINNRWDAAFKAMYIITGDKQFDGSGRTGYYAELHTGGNSDNFITTSLGLKYKLGKHNEHLAWVDPLREAFSKINEAAVSGGSVEVCVFGDKDDDGVCDDWDRELDTPKGARVDGSGRALDVDMDGIIDLYDKCPTFPGVPNLEHPELHGCPEPKQLPKVINETIVNTMGGIQFNLDSDKILVESQPILDNVAEVILKYGQNTRFLVEGHTDARGSDAYNLNLSKRRVTSVIKYLVSKGVPPYQLTGKGMGFSSPKYPECKPATKCPEWKNRENRRVIFKLLDQE